MALVQGGADIIELGVPFSDPMADGPVIQAADERALQAGTNLERILGLIDRLRRHTQIPIVLMGYYNPIYCYGVKRFAKDAAQVGLDGCLIADCPPEEAGEVRGPLKRRGIDLIYLLAPTSTDERLRLVSKDATGYLYYVSMTGITGSQLEDLRRVKKHVLRVRHFCHLPVAVGFGIAKPEQAARVAQFAEGVVVGSALVRQIGEGAAPGKLEKMTRQFKRAIA